jgi:hypothetical protein
VLPTRNYCGNANDLLLLWNCECIQRLGQRFHHICIHH